MLFTNKRVVSTTLILIVALAAIYVWLFRTPDRVSSAVLPPNSVPEDVFQEAVTPKESAESVIPQVTPQTVEASLALRDIDVPTPNIDGSWLFAIGEDDDVVSRVWELEQLGEVITGSAENQPIVGLVKGNTFNVTVRLGGLGQRTKFSYRGVIDSVQMEMKGTVSVKASDDKNGETVWVARKI